jgi:tetratricopeptide (TPR) repeat protein
MALDARNRREDAIDLLRAHGDTDLDAWGVLAGRYKRRWLVNEQQADLDQALELYQKGYAIASTPASYNAGQAFYHGINLAYLQLASDRLADAKGLATAVLRHCDEQEKLTQKDAFWRLATEGDAYTMLGEKENTLSKHKQASLLPMNPWQALSIEEQAVRIADLRGWSGAEQDQLADLYLPR